MPLLILAGVMLVVAIGSQWSRNTPDPNAGPQWNRPNTNTRK